jgi:hypothetical protein
MFFSRVEGNCSKINRSFSRNKRFHQALQWKQSSRGGCVFALKIEPPSGIFLKSPKIDRIMPKSGGQSAKRRSNIVVTNA